MKRVLPLLALSLLLRPAPACDTDECKKNFDQLVEQLSSKDAAVRDRAAADLVDEGDHFLDKLEKTGWEHVNPETKELIEKLVYRIRGRLAVKKNADLWFRRDDGGAYRHFTTAEESGADGKTRWVFRDTLVERVELDTAREFSEVRANRDEATSLVSFRWLREGPLPENLGKGKVEVDGIVGSDGLKLTVVTLDLPGPTAAETEFRKKYERTIPLDGPVTWRLALPRLAAAALPGLPPEEANVLLLPGPEPFFTKARVEWHSDETVSVGGKDVKANRVLFIRPGDSEAAGEIWVDADRNILQLRHTKAFLLSDEKKAKEGLEAP